MADEKLTQQPIATSAADNDLFYIVRVSDGLSMQITKDNFLSNFLKANQTITLSGDATGSGTTSITVTVADNSHNHTIENVTGLSNALNARLTAAQVTKALIDALGVNADTLDGLQGSQFLRSDVDDTMTGNFTATGDIFTSGNFYLQSAFTNGSSSNKQIIIGGTDNGYVNTGATSHFRIQTYGNASGQNFELQRFLRGTGYVAGINYLSNGNLTTTGAITATGTIQAPLFLEGSDKRLKTKIKDLQTNHIPVKWKEFELKSNKGKKRYGVIAQELEKTNPELVHTNDDGFKSVNYIDFLCIKSAEQENEIEQLKILVKQLIDNGTTN